MGVENAFTVDSVRRLGRRIGMDPHNLKESAEYVWWQPPWRRDWYQWVFLLALGFCLNLLGLFFYTDFVDRLGAMT